MSAQILDGKKISSRIKEEIKANVAKLKLEGINPGLAVIIVGEDPASKVYVNSKKKTCEELGIRSFEYVLKENTTETELSNLITDLNKNKEVNGILIQLPLPKHINEEKIIALIDPIKDVDCFHPYNVGKVMIGKSDFIPCTPAGVMEMIKESGIKIEGKECVIIGRSNIVGKPQAILLLGENATVTVCHSRTKDLKEVCKRADILVAAVGRPEMVTADYIKLGAVVIDVGVNRLENKKLVGDVDFESVKEIASYISPVPGGVGPMTIVMLMKNTLIATKLQNTGANV